jgi:Rod binding domain-containing protein
MTLARLEGAHGAAGAEPRPAPEPRLVHAAHQFEAQMMKELLKPMTEKDLLFRDGDGEGSGILGQFASESLAGALSAGGGLGIADRIVHDLSRFGHDAANPQVIGKLQNNTGMSSSK